MTDNEIIKALECCTYNITQEKCDECPLYGGHCTTELAKNALDLINRQKAEIERLEGEIDKQYEQAKADILGNMADGGISCHWCIEQHKAEAVKEFAERLKATPIKYGIEHTEYYDKPPIYKLVPFIDDDDIDNLLKETVGAAK